jgi:hypothetical protein
MVSSRSSSDTDLTMAASRWRNMLLGFATVLLAVAPALERCGFQLGSGRAASGIVAIAGAASVPEAHQMPAEPGSPCSRTPTGQAPHGSPCPYLSSCSAQFVSGISWRPVAPVSIPVAVSPGLTAALRSRTTPPISPPPKA